VEFKLYLTKEFQRLKEDENRRMSLAWDLNRTLSKLNYRIRSASRRICRVLIASRSAARRTGSSPSMTAWMHLNRSNSRRLIVTLKDRCRMTDLPRTRRRNTGLSSRLRRTVLLSQKRTF
jgi:hypothetical protein